MNSKDLSEKFREKRKELKLSQEEVAKTIGVDQKTISHWENGVNEPQFKKIRMFCDNYNIPLSFFLEQSLLPGDKDNYVLDYYSTFENYQNCYTEKITLSKKFFSEDLFLSSFVLKMQGKSMLPKYNDGDFLIIRPVNNTKLSDNSVYLFEYEGDIYLRYISKNLNTYLISAENKEFPQVIITCDEYKNLNILGEVAFSLNIN